MVHLRVAGPGGAAVDVQTIRRSAPLVYGAVVVITLFVARDAFVPVIVVGAILLGLLYTLTGRWVQRSEGPGRDRQRRRDRDR